MNGVCRDTHQDLLQVAKDLENYRDLLDLWLNGDETQCVMLGGVCVPTIRKLVHDIDERESQGAQTIVDEGIQGMNVIMEKTELIRKDVLRLRDEIQDKINKIKDLTATVQVLPAGSTPTVSYDYENSRLDFKLPKGDKGDPGPPGSVAKQYLDVIDCGGAYPGESVIIVDGGHADSTYPNV